MLRGASAAALALAAIAAAPAAAKVNKLDDLRVEPRSGPPTKRFHIRFTARNDMTRHRRLYDVEATGPDEDAPGCVSGTANFIHPPKGKKVTVILPRRPATPDWCLGHYKGYVFYEVWDRYGDTIRDKIVGRFSFDVAVAAARR